MSEKFSTFANGIDSPATGSSNITPNNSLVFSPVRALWIGSAGNLAVRMLDGTTPIFIGIPAGTILPIRCDKVLATGTTVTDVVGLY